MKLARVALRSANEGNFCRRFNRMFSSSNDFNDQFSVGSGSSGSSGANQNENWFDVSNENEDRIFGETSQDKSNTFYRALDKVKKGGQGSGMGFTSNKDPYGLPTGDDDALTTLKDGMDGKLKDAAAYFEIDPDEIASPDYAFRADMNLKSRMTYVPEDLNIRKPGVWKTFKRTDFEVTTKEVLENADFRNVRFLANFLTEAGTIIKRRQTGISAKAQRKVVREIKIARAFGLLPFTTMGTKAFVVGKTMESLDQDFELDPYDMPPEVDDVQEPVAE